MVCIGPPLPSIKPPPHGTRHCQRKMPPCRGVTKLNDSTACGPEVQGDTPHRLLAESRAFGEATGTNRCSAGIAKVWATVQPAQELITETFRGGVATPLLLMMLRFTVPPIVPWTWLQKLFRSGVQPSYPRMVMCTLVPAGTENSVVCTHCLVL